MNGNNKEITCIKLMTARVASLLYGLLTITHVCKASLHVIISLKFAPGLYTKLIQQTNTVVI